MYGQKVHYYLRQADQQLETSGATPRIKPGALGSLNLQNPGVR